MNNETVNQALYHPVGKPPEQIYGWESINWSNFSNGYKGEPGVTITKELQRNPAQMEQEKRTDPQELEWGILKSAYYGWKVISPAKIIVNGTATIVIWSDNTKTVVKCMDGDTFDVYNTFCAAFAKKLYGSNGLIKQLIKNALPEPEEEEEKDE